MSRPQKLQLDYFPDDCNIEPEWEILSIKYGGIVFAIRSTLLKRIYGVNGYYMNWDEENSLLHSGRYHIDLELLCKVVEDACNRGIFNADMYKNHGILTSAHIQQVYLLATAKRKGCEINSEFMLVCEEETPQIKKKESKINKNKKNKKELKDISLLGERKETNGICAEDTHPQKKRYGKHLNVLLTEEEYNSLKEQYSYLDLVIDRLSDYLSVSGKVYQNHSVLLGCWAEEDKEKYLKKQEDDFYQEFFEMAVKRKIPL